MFYLIDESDEMSEMRFMGHTAGDTKWDHKRNEDILRPIYTRRVNVHSIPTLLNLFSVNRPRAFFRCSMEYSKNARSV